jgi:hypothetical protein
MRFRNVREILDWTKTFHEALATEYEEMAIGHERERVGLLLSYLADHERVLSDALTHYEEDQTHSILETCYAPDVELPEDVHALAEKIETLDTMSVMKLAVQFHEILVCLYRKLAEKAPSQEVKALFENIARHESREKINTVRNTGQFEDV